MHRMFLINMNCIVGVGLPYLRVFDVTEVTIATARCGNA